MPDKREGITEDAQNRVNLRAKTSVDSDDRRIEQSNPITGTVHPDNPDKFLLDTNTFISGTDTLPKAKKDPTIIETTSPGVADTEFTVAIPVNTVSILVQARVNTTIKLAYATQGTYLTIKPGVVYTDDALNGDARTLYLKTADASRIIETLVWTS